MKKTIVLIAMALVSIALAGQEQPPVMPDEQPQAQAAEAAPAPVQPQGRDLNGVSFPSAFIHAGKEYPAGKYEFVLGDKDGRPVFFVANDRKEPLFEELAVVKARRAGGAKTIFHVDVAGMRDKEYFRVMVTTYDRWVLGFFLVKK